MSNADLRVGRALELMKKLKETVAEFARKEAKVARELGSRKLAEDRKYWDESEKTDAWLTTERSRAETWASDQIGRIQKAGEARRTRIERLKRAGMTNLRKQAKEAKDRWLSEIQMRHFTAGRQLPIDMKAVDARHAEASGELEIQQTRLALLERQIRSAFAAFPGFKKLLKRSNEGSAGDANVDELLDELEAKLAEGETKLAEFRRLVLPKLLKAFPLAVMIPLLLIAAGTAGYFLGATQTDFVTAGGVAAGLILLLLVVRLAGKTSSQGAANALVRVFLDAAEIYYSCASITKREYAAERSAVQNAYDEANTELNAQWQRADEIEEEFATSTRAKLENQVPRMFKRHAAMLAPKLARIEAERAAWLERTEAEGAKRKSKVSEVYSSGIDTLKEEETRRWAELEASWKHEIHPLYEALGEIDAKLQGLAPDWTPDLLSRWQPGHHFPIAAKFGALEVDLSTDPTALPKDARLTLPGLSNLAIPLSLTFPGQGSLLLETNEASDLAVSQIQNNIILRLLLTTQPGKVAFTIIDPVGLGQNYAGLMHLADFEETLINRRIWTQRDQIEDRLAELNEHVEKVIQMYLRNEYASITEYNAKAGSVAERYHFLVVSDFPANFSETAAKRLQSLAVSGPRCGVFTLIHWDRRQTIPDGFSPDELKKVSVHLRRDRNEWVFPGEEIQPGKSLTFDVPPDAELFGGLVRKIGQASIDSNRVEVPFSQIAPKGEERWTNETTNELRIPIGRTGATKLQYLAIGKGTRQHALFAGKTGSGKSTLFHVIITNLALSCSPDQVEFYLIDFKKGVEFKCYADKRLPHAKVVAIESDREFGLSVLHRVDEELKRRGDLFRKLGVQDVAGYKRAGGNEPMPRSLLIIDEFQEFFVEDDQIAQSASLLFDRIVRQGRAFGIHVLLGSQTLGGAYTLARATLGQMVIRVALQCNEADAYLIMDDNNPAPRLLSRPGEGIYNDSAGALEGNSPFQVVWLSDEEREARLEDVRALAISHGWQEGGPIVFEGNAPANVEENDLLAAALRSGNARAAVPRVWLGAPNSIKGPTEVHFPRQSGSNLLLVGQREESMLAMLGVSLAALVAQRPDGQYLVIHAPAQGELDFLSSTAKRLAPKVELVASQAIPEKISGLSAILKERSAEEENAESAPVFVLIHGLQKFKKLRNEDEFDFGMSGAEPSAGAQLGKLLTEGPTHGIHFLVTFDTFGNVGRCLSRKALSEFDARVVLQMGANDSASLIDSPQASALGLHRALLYHESQGSLETFRPYATPESDWG